MKSCPKCLNLSADNAMACEYCGTVLDESIIARADRPARPTTLVEPASGTRPSPPPSLADVRPTTSRSEFRPAPPPSVSEFRPSLPSPSPASGRRGQTVYMPPPVEGTATRSGLASQPRPAARKVIAVLVSYSWTPEGQVFPVREGRNLIGRGDECEIRITNDPAMSQVNSHITFRQSFVVGDMVSMSGTDLNGDPVEEQFRPLKNYAQIRTGSTHWTFVIIDPALAGV